MIKTIVVYVGAIAVVLSSALLYCMINSSNVKGTFEYFLLLSVWVASLFLRIIINFLLEACGVKAKIKKSWLTILLISLFVNIVATSFFVSSCVIRFVLLNIYGILYLMIYSLAKLTCVLNDCCYANQANVIPKIFGLSERYWLQEFEILISLITFVFLVILYYSRFQNLVFAIFCLSHSITNLSSLKFRGYSWKNLYFRNRVYSLALLNMFAAIQYYLNMY